MLRCCCKGYILITSEDSLDSLQILFRISTGNSHFKPMTEASDISDVSGNEPSDTEKSNGSRGSAPVELTDLPALVPDAGNPEDIAREDLAEFWQNNPVKKLKFEGLNEEQLLAIDRWMQDTNLKLKENLELLRTELRAQWWEKEALLDKLLQPSIGESLSPWD